MNHNIAMLHRKLKEIDREKAELDQVQKLIANMLANKVSLIATVNYSSEE
ncbi:hypothetical protein [Paenibacillus sp. P46E]|nr:hypothetical protein [Paenibacillus sp. P46E]